MFVGTYKRTVDDKWRLPLPADLFAPGFEGDRDTLYFAPAGDHLILFSGSTFHRLSEQLMARSVMAHREIRRTFFGNTYPKQRDKSGRIQIPEPLRSQCGLGPKIEAEIVGTGPYMEIRPAETDRDEPGQEVFTNILDALEALGES